MRRDAHKRRTATVERMMTKLMTVLLISMAVWTLPAVAQKSKSATSPLRLLSSTPLPGIKGDFDHFAVDVKNDRLYLAAEDHQSVEVFDLRSGKHLRSINGFGTPHSILPLPESGKILVVDGGVGEVKVLNARSYAVIGSIKLLLDADSMVYDARNKKL